MTPCEERIGTIVILAVVPKSERASTLTLDAIVDQSVCIIQDSGVSGLTMRAVAAGLGVTPMAVYYYVSDKEELMGLVVERVTSGTMPLRFDPDDDWRDTLREYMLNSWSNLRRFPGLSAYAINHPQLGVAPERLEAGLAFFESAGFLPADAPLAWSFALTYMHGRISVDARLGGKADAPHLRHLKSSDYLNFGVDAVVAGLEAMLDRHDGRRRDHEPGTSKRAAMEVVGT